MLQPSDITRVIRRDFDPSALRDDFCVAFFDIDGTLVPRSVETKSLDAVPGERMTRLLHEFVDAGNVAAISTGRNSGSIREGIMALPFQGAVLGDGALVELGHSIVADDPMPEELAWRVLEECECSRSATHFQSPYVDCRFSPSGDRFSEDELTYATVAEIRELYPELHIWKMDMQADNWERFAEITTVLGDVEHFDAGSGAHELTAKGVSKASGARALIQAIGKSPAHVIAFGDSGSDLAVFELSDIAVAVGNADAIAKDNSDILAEANYDEGVAEVLLELEHLWR